MAGSGPQNLDYMLCGMHEEILNPAIPLTLQALSVSLSNCGGVFRALGGEKNLKEALRFYEQLLKIRGNCSP